MLKGKTAVVTGSTSGLGPGIARTLAGKGANVMLNGFGPAAEIERLRGELAAEHGVEGLASGAGMKARKWGRIVNIASAHGLVASPFKSAYVAAKHGIVGFTKVIALEGAEAGVTCNAICPGYVWTPLVERQIEDQAKAHGVPREDVIRNILLAQQPNKRFATVEEIGALTAFLCSDAATSVTGTALPVDGGWTAH
ncbi:MAG: SDR family oxidoreductase [Proteobacteria bacterium]|nr:SDR family oxidoreductase [Pseudomonadota bacterium]